MSLRGLTKTHWTVHWLRSYQKYICQDQTQIRSARQWCDPTKNTSVRIKLRSEVHDNGAILPKVHPSGSNSDQKCMTMDHFQQLFIIKFSCVAVMKVIKIKSKFKLHCTVQMTKSLHTHHFYTLQPRFWSRDPPWPSWLRMVCGIATVASSLKAE